MKRTFISTRTALLFASVFVLVCCLAVASLVPIAQAYTSSNMPTGDSVVGEIFIDDATTGGTFDRDNLQKLINKVAGVYSDIQKDSNGNVDVDSLFGKLNGSSTNVDGKIYSDTQRINGQNIIVEFGGIKWFAAFLSLADTQLDTSSLPSGFIGNKPTANASEGAGVRDVVLTLWQAEPNTGSERTSTYSATTPGYGTQSQNTDVNYPSNMYGTSLIRAKALNNGGIYSTSGTATTKQDQSPTNVYAKFNMEYYGEGSANKSNIHNFLVAPRYLTWQKSQLIPSSWNWTEKGKALNNQAWGEMGQGAYYDSTYPYYEKKDNYTQWKEDLLWIPSCSEVGNTYQNQHNVNIWGLSKDQRAFGSGSASEYLWLRTGSTSYYRANGLACEGITGNLATSGSWLVRPALHLNLTAAMSDIEKPTVDREKTVTYNGQVQSFDLGLKSEYVTDGKVTLVVTPNDGTATVENDNGTQVLTATKAGTYTLTVHLADGYYWENPSDTTDTSDIASVTFTLTINKAPLTVTAKNAEIRYGENSPTVGVTYSGFVNGEDESVLKGELKISYGDYSVGSGVGSYEITPTGLTADNYEIEYKNGTLTVVNADLTLSGNFTATYEYELDGNGAPVKRELKIAESQVTVVNGQKVTIKYGTLSASTSGYDSSDDGYAVWKVGTYFVDVTISAPNHNEITQRITVTIVKAKPTVTPLCDRSEIWTSGVLPELTCTATLRNNQSVNGAISWITSLGTVRSDGYYDFYYRWVPEDQENFEIVDGDECYVRLYVRFASVTRFTVTFDPEGELFYETDSLNILKNYLTVTVTFSDGTTRVLGMNEYDLNCQGGSTLVAGDSVTVTVSYLSAGTPVERNFNVQVLAVERPPVDTPPTGDNPDPAPKDPTGDTISKAKEFFENTPLPLGYAALVLGGMLLLIIILAIAGRKPKKKD